MSGLFHLIVTDTSPLITLALADALDLLLRPSIPVSIPDAVYIEATRVRTAAGASRIVEWMNDHLDGSESSLPRSVWTGNAALRRAERFGRLANRQRSKYSNAL